MKATKNIAIVALALGLVGTSALAWHQYREMIALKAQLADGDASALKRQLAEATKTIRSLQDRIASMRGRSGAAGGGQFGEGGPGDGPGGPGGRGPGGRFGAFAALANNPEFQKLMAIQAKSRVSQTYGALFKSLNLSPDQLNQFQTLLADKQQALMDVMQAAREQGINPRTDPDGFKTLVTQAVGQVDQQIQQTLGDAAYQQYQQYQQTLPERNVVNQLQQQLSYTQTPLTDDQANAMISLLQSTQPQRSGNGTSGTTDGGEAGPGLMALVNGGGTARVTSDAVTQASGVLSADQLAALQQIQQEQQAQAQMRQLMRQAGQGGGTTTPPVSATGGGKG